VTSASRTRRRAACVLLAVTCSVLVGIAGRPGQAAGQSASQSLSSAEAKASNPAQGFDACNAPSLATMTSWWEASPYTSIGVYIGGAQRACSQPNLTASWVTATVGQGWGLIPIWVGPQAPCTNRSVKIPEEPTQAGAQGVVEADAAATAAAALGLPPGSPIYYDMEAYARDGACIAAVQWFTSAWVGELHARGYVAGYYSSLCSGIQDQAAIYQSPFFNTVDALWIAAWNNTPNIYGFSGGCALADNLWDNHRRLHQFRGGHSETWGGVSINIDNNAVDGPVASPAPAVPTVPTVPMQRIFGLDAIDTSLAISAAEFTQGGAADAVVLARSDYFADALAGGPLAAARNGPLLITPGAPLAGALDPRVLTEIQRVLPAGHFVYVLGGPLALGPGIDAALQALGYTVVRIQGSNQFGTAVAIAGELGNPQTIFEATGLGFADALSAVPAAIQTHGAILLTNGTIQAPETAAYLAAHPPVTRFAIGGPLAAAGADPAAIAVYGQDQYGTSANVAGTFFPSASTFGAATGLTFPDALSGGVFMGTAGRLGPVLLVRPSLPLPASIALYLIAQTSITHGYVFGGPLAVGDDVMAAL